MAQRVGIAGITIPFALMLCFAIAGIGPRELNAGSQGAVGGEAYAIGTVELRIPEFLPADYGISASLFTDFGTVGHVSGRQGLQTCGNVGPHVPCIEDSMSLRAAGGLAVGWKSPFGPIEIDFGVPYIKQNYDKTQVIRFSAGTGL